MKPDEIGAVVVAWCGAAVVMVGALTGLALVVLKNAKALQEALGLLRRAHGQRKSDAVGAPRKDGEV